MKYLFAFALLCVSLFGQTFTPPPGTVTTTFLISADLGNNRQAIVQCSVVYPDTLEPAQYPDLVAVATELSNYLRNYPDRASTALEALAAGAVRNILSKYEPATGTTVIFSLGAQGSTQITAQRLNQKAPPQQQQAAAEALAEFRRHAAAARTGK